MSGIEQAAFKLASILRADAPMGKVLISMPVGEPMVSVALVLAIRGNTYAAEYRFSGNGEDDEPRDVARRMIRAAGQKAGA